MGSISDWFAAIIREIEDSPEIKAELRWDYDDELFAKKVHLALREEEDGKVLTKITP